MICCKLWTMILLLSRKIGKSSSLVIFLSIAIENNTGHVNSCENTKHKNFYILEYFWSPKIFPCIFGANAYCCSIFVISWFIAIRLIDDWLSLVLLWIKISEINCCNTVEVGSWHGKSIVRFAHSPSFTDLVHSRRFAPYRPFQVGHQVLWIFRPCLSWFQKRVSKNMDFKYRESILWRASSRPNLLFHGIKFFLHFAGVSWSTFAFRFGISQK